MLTEDNNQPSAENGNDTVSTDDSIRAFPFIFSAAVLTKRFRDEKFSRKSIAKLCIFATGLLITVKIIVAIYTGSLGIRADAVHSLVDLISAIAVYIGIRVADKPRDEKHNFGYANAENIAALFILAIILFGAAWIVYGALHRTQHDTVTMLPVGIYVTLAAIILNVVIAGLAVLVARQTESIALEAQGYHMFTDVLSSVAVLAGLVLVAITGYIILDTIIALVVMVLILRTGWKIGKKVIDGLMDAKIPPQEELIIRKTIMHHRQQIAGLKRLRTRKTGSQREIDVEIIVPGWENMVMAHDTCNTLEQNLKELFPQSILAIHVEPCPNSDMQNCPAKCPVFDTCNVKKLLDSW